jgi:acetoin utilization protein AcuB
MFSIYGVAGQTFRGTLENLRTVDGLAPLLHSRGIAREGEEPGQETSAPQAASRGAGGSGGGSYQSAAEAYRNMLQATPERGPVYHVYQIMARDVATLPVETGVDAAWRFLTTHGYAQAPVLDAAGSLVGMVTLTDLLTILNVDAGGVRDVLVRTVAEVMTTPVVTTDPVSDVRRVARVLLDYHLNGMPVVGEQGDLVGIVTRSDILRAVMHDPPLSLWA